MTARGRGNGLFATNGRGGGEEGVAAVVARLVSRMGAVRMEATRVTGFVVVVAWVVSTTWVSAVHTGWAPGSSPSKDAKEPRRCPASC